MPDYISRMKLKKKVLDRWENEGGKVFADEKLLPTGDKAPEQKKKRPGKLPEAVLILK